MILHITSIDVWEKSKKDGIYEGDTLSSQGFIHCSTEEQLSEVANFLFKSRLDLVLLVIDENKVVPDIKYEDPGNKKLYPHIYGPLNLDAIVNVVDFPPNEDGMFVIPRKF